MRRRRGSSSSSESRSMLRPKSRTWPRSGRMRPAISRSVTVLPEPLPPMMTSVSPRSTVSDTPRSTGPASKLFHTSSTSIRRSPSACVMLSPSPEEDQEELGQEEVRDDDAHGDVHDRVRGGAAEPLGAALGGEAVVTADQRDDDAKEDAL